MHHLGTGTNSLTSVPMCMDLGRASAEQTLDEWEYTKIMKNMFKVTGNALLVTDPCYTRGTWCQGILADVCQGDWQGQVEVMSRERTGWGDRVSKLIVTHGSFYTREPSDVGTWHVADFEVGVDSGMAGVFDEGRYPQGDTGAYRELDTFYGRACAVVHDEKDDTVMAGVVDEGFLSYSGFGDGGYTCEYHRNAAGLVDFVSITFIDEEIDDEEEE